MKQQTTTQRAGAKRSLRAIEVPVKQLRWRCAPEELGISRMEDVKPLKEIIGQNRALRALQVGLEMKHYGYNIFVTGFPGTGRATTIRRMLSEFESRKVDLTDKCFVHNFRDADTPLMISLPAGQGLLLKRDMTNLLNEVLKGIPAIFESRRYIEQRKAMLEHFQDRQRIVLKDFEKKVKDRGFEVVQVQGGAGNRPEIAPVIDGSPVSLEQLHAKADSGEISREDFNKILSQQSDLEGQMDIVMREMRNIERRAKRSMDELNNKMVVPLAEELLEDIRKKYRSDKLTEYLDEIKRHVLENLTRFHQKEEPQQSVLGFQIPKEEDTFTEFQVNVIVDNSDVTGVPVIIETNPRYKNLFGTIERVVDRNGIWRTDFTQIKAGSIVRADNGYLVINALDALTEPGVWVTLKRVLRNRQIEIQPMESGLLGASSALKPEPVDLNVKVIMIGDSNIYQVLYNLDEDFKKIFKVRADFDTEMPNDQKSITSYISFVKTLSDQEKLIPADLSGVTELVEYGVRLSGRQNKLSTRFSVLADVLREASYWASREHATTVTAEHVRKAIDERIERVKLVEEKIQEMIDDGSILIDADGAVVGQVNGLSVYSLGEHEFGRPSRITAKTAMGRAGIINIEREASMSGPTHNKGVLILSGYLRSMYAQRKPLVLSASVAFEQSYSGVDGDSASSTEIYAILSSLSGVPLRQDIAVTGSVNQHGEIQPIGGVNLKIEGFFDVCKARELTGKQGVLIPHQNVKDLMLRHDVVEAVEKGLFHIYEVKHVDEGIELLTGIPAGTTLRNGTFTPGSIHARVDTTLATYAREHKKFRD
jgi:lon-related putative ATP-dependent protease